MSSDTAQDYQKLLSDALQKQILILGPQVALLKAHTVPGLQFADNGQVTEITDDPQKVITQFVEAYRGLSAPLVKKTMKPLISTILSPAYPIATRPEVKQKQEVKAS